MKMFTIPLNNIKRESKAKIENAIKIIKNPKLDYTQKLVKVLKEEKTEEIKIKKEYINDDESNNSIEQNMNKVVNNYQSYSDKDNTVLSGLTEWGTYYKKSTTQTGVTEFNNSNSSSINDRDIPKSENYSYDLENSKDKKLLLDFNINIEFLRELEEEKIQEKISNINDLNINQYQKRILVLKNQKTSTINMKKEIIPVFKIREEYKNRINEEMSKITNENLNKDEIKEIVLKKEKSSSVKQNIITNINLLNISIDNNPNNESISTNETKDANSSSIISISSNFSSQLLELDQEKKTTKKLNTQRGNFYLKKKIYDILLNRENKDAITPEKYFINEIYFCFLYPNNLQTYYICSSGILLNHKENKMEIEDINKYKEKCDKQVGIYFCGKEINIKNEIKICSKNNFICRECMQINKRIYNIKEHYLININGRVAKINKNKYHCFGHFLRLKDNIIEDCITDFSCEACKILNDKEILYYYKMNY